MNLALLDKLSSINKWPFLGKILKRKSTQYLEEDIEKFRAAQRLAYHAAQEVGKMLAPGWSEKRAARMLEIYCRDSGAQNFLHKGFAWFGERSRFGKMKDYWESLPTDRELNPGEVVILDIAPIVDSYPADIGYALCLGENKQFDFAIDRLKKYREQIPSLFIDPQNSGASIYQTIDQWFKDDGFENVHQRYPLGVLAHKMYPLPLPQLPGLFRPFTWQAYWGVISHGMFSEAITHFHQGDLDGLWAVEPHFGYQGFGVKFEEMLWVKDGQAEWIDQGCFYV